VQIGLVLAITRPQHAQSGAAGGGVDNILLESGDNILLESGDLILKE
jgi:hypothetical protein